MPPGQSNNHTSKGPGEGFYLARGGTGARREQLPEVTEWITPAKDKEMILKTYSHFGVGGGWLINRTQTGPVVRMF